MLLGIPTHDPSTSAGAPSYQELVVGVASLRAAVVEQAGLIDKLTIEIGELRARLNMNSLNSSKPPRAATPSRRPSHAESIRARSPPGSQGIRVVTWPSAPIPL